MIKAPFSWGSVFSTAEVAARQTVAPAGKVPPGDFPWRIFAPFRHGGKIPVQSTLSVMVFIALTLLPGCQKKKEEPNFPIEPYIEFKGIRFTDAPNNAPDTITTSFYFRDGDFDLGLAGTTADASEPFNQKFYFLKTSGSRIADNRIQSGEFSFDDILTYADKRVLQPDTLPGFVTPFSCTNWEIIHTNPTTIDTIYLQFNPNYYDLFVNIIVIAPDGSSSIFDFSQFAYPICQVNGLNARFPPPKEYTGRFPFIVQMISSKEGTMTYRLPSADWTTLFSGNKIKLTLAIQDRALHRSNTVETSEIQF